MGRLVNMKLFTIGLLYQYLQHTHIFFILLYGPLVLQLTPTVCTAKLISSLILN